MEWLALEIISIFVAKGVDYFTGILGSIRKLRLKNQLKKRLSSGILKNYGNEVFYNDLDAFLMQNKVISKTIENCYDASPSEYKSQKAYVEFYIRMFEEKYPQYIACFTRRDSRTCIVLHSWNGLACRRIDRASLVGYQRKLLHSLPNNSQKSQLRKGCNLSYVLRVRNAQNESRQKIDSAVS